MERPENAAAALTDEELLAMAGEPAPDHNALSTVTPPTEDDADSNADHGD